jgi:hypothetical protein
MAIFHLKLTLVRRGEGRSAVAAAGYRAGQRLTDDRTGRVHDYSRRRDVAADGIVGWSGSRSELWNAAECRERHPRAVVAREITAALPAELSDEARRRLAQDFVRFLRERHRVAVDWAIHAPRAASPKNWHLHVMLTTRRVSADGGQLEEKTRELDERHTGAKHIAMWRRTLADYTNDALFLAGASARVDHRSHAAAGRPVVPLQHLGPGVSAMEARGQVTEKGERNRRRGQLNQERRAAQAELVALRRRTRAAAKELRFHVKHMLLELSDPEPSR